MKEYTPTELAVGLFVILGLGSMGYLSASIGGLHLFPKAGLSVSARFASVGDLRSGAPVKIAGVTVGSVEEIRLENYAAQTRLNIENTVELPKDTIASIRTEGLLGESYVLLRPGGSLENLKDGDKIGQTEPAIDLIDLVVKYALSDKDEDSSSSAPKEQPNKDAGLPELFE